MIEVYQNKYSKQWLIRKNGKIVRNQNSCPMGAATFATEQEAKEYASRLPE